MVSGGSGRVWGRTQVSRRSWPTEFDQAPMSIWATQVVLGYFLFFWGGWCGRAQESEGRPGRKRKSVSV